VSLIDGAASADSSVSGEVLPVTVSLIDGVATGTGDAEATGVVFTVTTSIQSGAVTAGADVSGVVLPVTISLIDGDQTASSEVSINWGTIILTTPTFLASNGTDVYTGNKYWLRRSKPNARRLSYFIRWLLKQPIS
jgi:hypothetical protein